MLDPKLLRQDIDAVARNLARRGFALDRERYEALETERKDLQVRVETLRQQRNERSKQIGRAKAAGGDAEALKREVGELGNALEAAEARFRTLFEFAPIGTVLVDEHGGLVDVNRAGAELFGYTRDALLGVPVHELTHPEDRESGRELLTRLFAGEIDSYRVEKRYLHAGGHTIWAELNVTALPNEAPIAIGS
jgi:PAS domain S-box-containing protein